VANRVLLEIDCAAFERLLASNGLSLAEFRCANSQTKQQVQDMYLHVMRRQVRQSPNCD
jgi:hypothetical protein